MAPAAKRKKPSSDDQAPVPATKLRGKRQKTTADPTNSIETPPPTPKPVAAPRGRKNNAAKNSQVNGDHPKANGSAGVEPGATVNAGNVSTEDSVVHAPPAKTSAPVTKRTAVDDDDDDDDESHDGDEPVTNGHKDVIASKAVSVDLITAAGSEKQPASNSQPAMEKTAKNATPAIQPPAPKTLEVPHQVPITTSTTSPAIKSEEPPTIRPTTEPVPSMEQAKKKDKIRSKDREKRDKLYQYCIKTKPVGEIFSIAELTSTKIADDDQDLLNLCQQLVTHFLFAAMTLNRGILYKTRSYEVAKKLAILGENHILIYSLIENAGRAGLWMRPLEIKSGLHQAILRKTAKELVQAGVVQEVKSAETSKKTYISADVKPDEKHIGGGFMDEGKFDEGMINSLTGMVVRFVENNSWARQTIATLENPDRAKSLSSTKHKSKPPGTKATKTVSTDQPVITIGDDTPALPTITGPSQAPELRTERQLYHPAWVRGGKALIPHHPAYYNKYPTAMDVMLEINEQKVVKDIVFTLKDAEQLLQKMEFDGYLERMRDSDGVLQTKEPRWRATKRVWKVDVYNESSQHFGPIEPEHRGWLPGNGLSQVPCMRCPVKAKCKPDGVVNPEECKYLDEWLSF